MTVTDNNQTVCTFIGQRIRERRKLLRLSQSYLAEMMGLSYQQIQKYEIGASHVSAGRLLEFAGALNVPLGYFFDGLKLEETLGKRVQSSVIQRTRTQPLHILLIESNPDDVLLFSRMLNECAEGAMVCSAHNAEKAMDHLQHYESRFGRRLPDIVVLDISMPKTHGIEILKSIKRHPRTMEVPVVVLTNSTQVKDMMESYRHGAAGFIQKSVDLNEYRESLEVLVKYWSKTVVLPCN